MPSIITAPSSGLLARGLRRIIDVRPAEASAVGWSWLYVFVLFLAYYVLRPIRDELGVAGGVQNLPWLFTGTLLAMLAVNPLFAYAVRRWPRERFIAIAYRFFMLNLLVFMMLLTLSTPEQHVWIGRAFFIWVSVFNLFIVSVFCPLSWTCSTRNRASGSSASLQRARGIAGSSLTSGFVESLGQTWLLLASIILLEVAIFVCVQGARRVSNFALARPTREVLFTSVPREDRYKRGLSRRRPSGELGLCWAGRAWAEHDGHRHCGSAALGHLAGSERLDRAAAGTC